MRMAVAAPTDLTGQYIKIMDRAGRVWFQGKAMERIGEHAYRFLTLRIGGKALEVEMIASVDELAGAALACA